MMHSTVQHGENKSDKSNVWANTNLAKTVAALDELKFGFPSSDGLTTMSNKWWGRPEKVGRCYRNLKYLADHFPVLHRRSFHHLRLSPPYNRVTRNLCKSCGPASISVIAFPSIAFMAYFTEASSSPCGEAASPSSLCKIPAGSVLGEISWFVGDLDLFFETFNLVTTPFLVVVNPPAFAALAASQSDNYFDVVARPAGPSAFSSDFGLPHPQPLVAFSRWSGASCR
ncbi:hypothetical protein ISN44_As07g009760 [Arabidopsis suecica]|uniref:Uncharacterized protein n=1 Tax=Arabidopsis suecica TaxID=45249 RepID=A0A8T2BMM6_ARASU|nr:hypothetical protein ISN44_As07g009760 [Arabidopsis suecica]